MLFAKKIELYFFEIIQFYFWKQMVYLVYEFLQKKERTVMETEKEVQVLTEKEMDDIVNFYYKEERKELKKICNQILHSIWNDIPNFYRDDFESLAGYREFDS